MYKNKKLEKLKDPLNIILKQNLSEITNFIFVPKNCSMIIQKHFEHYNEIPRKI